MIKEPLIKRRELLRDHFQEVKGQFLFATSLDTHNAEEVQEFLEESIKGKIPNVAPSYFLRNLDVKL